MALTVYEDRESVFAAIMAGACGYLLKGVAFDELVASLRQLQSGGAPMSPNIARRLLVDIQNSSVPRLASPPPPPQLLSARELAILRHIEQGLSYKEIAQLLGISTHTVHSHLKSTYEKFRAHGRHEAVIKARRLGIL